MSCREKGATGSEIFQKVPKKCKWKINNEETKRLNVSWDTQTAAILHINFLHLFIMPVPRAPDGRPQPGGSQQAGAGETSAQEDLTVQSGSKVLSV